MEHENVAAQTGDCHGPERPDAQCLRIDHADSNFKQLADAINAVVSTWRFVQFSAKFFVWLAGRVEFISLCIKFIIGGLKFIPVRFIRGRLISVRNLPAGFFQRAAALR